MRSTLGRSRADIICSAFRQTVRLVRQAKPSRAGIASLMSMAAAALCAAQPAKAQQVIATITGTASGTDRTGVFGFTPGTAFTNQPFNLVYTITVSNGQQGLYYTNGVPYGSYIESSGLSNPITATLTINNTPFTFGTRPISSVTSYVKKYVTSATAGADQIYFYLQEELSPPTGNDEISNNIISADVDFTSNYNWDSQISFSGPLTTAITSFDINYTTEAAAGYLTANSIMISGPVLPAVTGKNLGGPCPPATPDTLQSSPANPSSGGASTCGCNQPTATVGEPINAATGNMFLVETDFVGTSCTGLALKRYYNSQDTTGGAFGTGWRSAWQRSLTPVSSGTVIVTRADGREDTFTLNAGVWQADPDVTSVLKPVPATGTQTGWQLVTAADTTEAYSLTGQLTAVTTRAGLTTTLAYNSSGQLTSVTGPFGDTLKFTSNAAGQITQMTAPDGGVFSYAYDANNNLISVTHPDGSVRQYVYGDASFPNALTGIIDEDGNTYASWAYDAQGRAISSQHAGGADLTTVAYNADGSASATDADGNTHSYTFQTQFNAVKPAALSGAPYPPAGGEAFGYDGNGFVASVTDYDGNVTTYTHDTRGDQTSRTEASGTALARTISTAWLTTFHLPASITEPGRVTSFGYDAKGDLLKKTITAGSLTRSWAYTYNSFGQVLTGTDPRGNVTSYSYDTAGDVASVKDALGHVTDLTSYDADGRLLSMTDPNGLVTKLTYNFRGEVTSRKAGSEVTTYGYDAAGQLIKTTLPDGSFFSFTYDAAHRLIGIKDAAGDSVAYALDPASNVTKTQIFNPGGSLTQTRGYTYDEVNRVAHAIGAQGQITAYAYDPNSNLTGVSDPLSHVNAYSYDALNRLTGNVDPDGGATAFGYDALDHLTAVTDPRSLKTSYAWDALDDPTSAVSPDSGTTTRTFDAAGNVLTSTDARGDKTTYTYDALNRPIKAAYAGGVSVTWQYDQGTFGIGHITTMTDSSGSTSWTYDQHGRVLSKKQTSGGLTFKTVMSYDTAGRLATITYPSGAVITLSYDTAGRVSSLKSGAAALVSDVGYLPFGPAESWTQGNGGVYSRAFDQDGRIDSIGFGGDTMALAYDAASRITGVTETGYAAKSFAYDALDRLTSYISGSTNLTYGYDANGNRTSLGGSSSIAYTIAGASNRLLGAGPRAFTYDADGNLTADNQVTAILGYTYDASGRLVTAKTGAMATNYTNDGLGERVTRSGYGASSYAGGKQEFIYDSAGHLLGEYDGNGKAIEETVWLGDLPVTVLAAGSLTYYGAPDQLGAPHQLANPGATTAWHWDHDPFGNGAPTGSYAYYLRFPGQYYDGETGLHYNDFRDYDPSTGRYVQSDPIGIVGGLNTYTYAGENPLRFADKRGTQLDFEQILDISQRVNKFKDLYNITHLEYKCFKQYEAGSSYYYTSFLAYQNLPPEPLNTFGNNVSENFLKSCADIGALVQELTQSPPSLALKNCAAPSLLDILYQLSSPQMSPNPYYPISQITGMNPPGVYYLQPSSPSADPYGIIRLKVLQPYDLGYPNRP